MFSCKYPLKGKNNLKTTEGLTWSQALNCKMSYFDLRWLPGLPADGLLCLAVPVLFELDELERSSRALGLATLERITFFAAEDAGARCAVFFVSGSSVFGACRFCFF